MPNWWDSYQQAPSTALPAPGDPTSFSGGSSAGMTTPGRYDPETMRAFTIDLMANGGKGAAGILNNDPGQQYARSYANTTASNQSNLDFKQKMTSPMVDTIEKLKQIGVQGGPDVLKMAIGPDYGELSNDPSYPERLLKAPLPDTSGEFYQTARAGVRDILNFGGSYIPGLSQWTQGLADRGDAARDLNHRMHHLVEGIGAGVKAIPGTKNGGTSTDADQQLVLDAVGKALHASNPETFFAILDAEDLIKGRAGQRGQPAKPDAQSYLPPSWQQPPQNAAPAPAHSLPQLPGRAGRSPGGSNSNAPSEFVGEDARTF